MTADEVMALVYQEGTRCMLDCRHQIKEWDPDARQKLRGCALYEYQLGSPEDCPGVARWRESGKVS
jgi:hypothetical protein